LFSEFFRPIWILKTVNPAGRLGRVMVGGASLEGVLRIIPNYSRKVVSFKYYRSGVVESQVPYGGIRVRIIWNHNERLSVYHMPIRDLCRDKHFWEGIVLLITLLNALRK
jgi:hypothetical protein